MGNYEIFIVIASLALMQCNILEHAYYIYQIEARTLSPRPDWLILPRLRGGVCALDPANLRLA